MSGSLPRWLEEVRAQRRALQRQRRAQHEARQRAIDPIGAAQREAREQEFYRHRQEMMQQMEQDRRLFLNFGPWASPLVGLPPTQPAQPAQQPPQQPQPKSAATQSGAPPPGDVDSAQDTYGYELPDWDNGWYFRGW